METTINQRIELIIKSFKYRSVRAFADKIGVAQTSLNDIVKNGAEPKYGTLEKIMKVEPLISSEWLLTGKGPMLKPDQPSSVYQSGMNANYQGTFTEPIHTQIGDVGGDSIIGGIKGEGNAVGPGSSVSREERGKTEAMKLQQEIKRLTAQNSQLKEENNSLRKSNEELHKALIEEKERVIKILLEKK